jgi:hypothetical protein
MNIKPEFEKRLRDLGVYELWEANFNTQNQHIKPSSIWSLNKCPTFNEFIIGSFSWVQSHEGGNFWRDIARSTSSHPQIPTSSDRDRHMTLRRELARYNKVYHILMTMYPMLSKENQEVIHNKLNEIGL